MAYVCPYGSSSCNYFMAIFNWPLFYLVWPETATSLMPTNIYLAWLFLQTWWSAWCNRSHGTWFSVSSSPCCNRGSAVFSRLDKLSIYPILLFVTWLMGHDAMHYFWVKSPCAMDDMVWIAFVLGAGRLYVLCCTYWFLVEFMMQVISRNDLCRNEITVFQLPLSLRACLKLRKVEP